MQAKRKIIYENKIVKKDHENINTLREKIIKLVCEIAGKQQLNGFAVLLAIAAKRHDVYSKALAKETAYLFKQINTFFTTRNISLKQDIKKEFLLYDFYLSETNDVTSDIRKYMRQ